MKKQVIFSLSLLASVLASASTVTSDNTFGVLKITATSAETVIGVPWVGVGGGSVTVSNIVLTSNLKTGDYLYYYDGSGYKTWYLTADGGNWTPVSTVIKGNTVNAPGAASTVTLSRGKAIILKMANWDSREDKDIYIYGQYAALGSGDTTSITVPTSDGSVVWSLIAPPSATDFDLNGASVSIGDVKPVAGDAIITNLNMSTWIRYNNESSKWGRYTETTNKYGVVTGTSFTEGAVIKAGNGAWYRAEGGHTDNTLTIRWGTDAE